MANLAQIYDWFMTGKKPTQAQFWASWGSFWNKEETIPQSAISNLTTVLAAKTENDQFNAHKVAIDAHADLFEGKQSVHQKGVAGGYVPLDEFIKIASEYLSIVNDLVTGGATDLLSAEQGKVLQTQITAINTLLTSNDVNLDTVQELVDAIKTVETSLETILVNDLTTGGTTKALTAEMGKVLKGLIDGVTTAKFDIANISQDIEMDKASTTKVASVKQLYDFIVAGFKSWFLTINTQAGITYTFAINDYKKRTVFTNANPVTATVPINANVAIPIGSKIEYTQQGDGVVTIEGLGITFTTNLSLSMVKGETRILTKIATDTWTVEGNIIKTIGDDNEGYYDPLTKIYYAKIQPIYSNYGTHIYNTTTSHPVASNDLYHYKVQPKKGSFKVGGSGGSGADAFIYMGLPYAINDSFSFTVELYGNQLSETHYCTIKVKCKAINGSFSNSKIEVLGKAGAVDYNITFGYSTALKQYFIGFNDNLKLGYDYHSINVYDFIVPGRYPSYPVKIYNDLSFYTFSAYYGTSTLRIDETIQVN